MTDDQTKELAADLTATLDACAARLRGIQQDAEHGLLLLNQAMRSIAQNETASAPGEALETMLNNHHERLAASILAALQPGGSATPTPVEFRMDIPGRAARIGRRRVPLSESEFRVVEHLWEHRPAPVSRRMLLDHLYVGKDEPTEAVIDLYIFHIRQKLKSAGCRDATIESIRGQGWALRLGSDPLRDDTDEAP